MFHAGFVVAIGYAGAAATVWACIIPALLAKKSGLAPDEAGVRGPGGQPHGGGCHRLRGATAIFHLMAMAGLLPSTPADPGAGTWPHPEHIPRMGLDPSPVSPFSLRIWIPEGMRRKKVPGASSGERREKHGGVP